MKKRKVCIAPLDWGLGHATRCIPLIKALQALDYEVYIGSEGHHESLLRTEIADAVFLPLRGYRVYYSKNSTLFNLTMLLQLPKIIYAIYNEQVWIKKMHRKFQFDLIIADNRYGIYHKQVKSIFMTHQLNIQTPKKWLTNWVQHLQYQWYKKFNRIWIPDMPIKNNLSGILGNPLRMPTTPTWYMGTLSRLIVANFKNEYYKEQFKFLGMVSGPEPQRTLFEKMLWNSGTQSKERFVIVAGRPFDKNQEQMNGQGILYPHLDGTALAEKIQAAEWIVCRGGYTSLMELIPFHKKIILVPTPGQTEQLYLAQYWQKNNWALYFDQAEFNLDLILKKSADHVFEQPPFEPFSIEGLKVQLEQLSLS